MVTSLMRWMTVCAGMCAALLAATPTASWGQGRTAYMMSWLSTDLLTVDTANPGTPIASVPITGVTPGELLVDLDIRPLNGMLYALGVNGNTDTMTLYVLSPRTGVATPVGVGGVTGAGNLPDPHNTSAYGIDFDPTTDRLRVVTFGSGGVPLQQGLNFRINPTTGALVQADTDINPPTTRVKGVAYTNNGLGSTVTSLYTITATTIYIQNPQNSGTQTQGVALSRELGLISGFDLDEGAVTTVSGTPVTAGSSKAYVLGTDGTLTIGIYRVNLLTGEVGPRLVIGGRGLAVQPYTAPGNLPAIALSANGLSLLRFSTADPTAVVEAIIDSARIVAGDVLVAIDMRPQTGQLYALGFNAVNNTVQLYLADPWTNVGGTTASVTAVGAPIALTLPGATAFGFDFNPTTDRIRVVSNAGENFRLNPNTGALTLTDTAINPAGAVVTGAAYTNNFGQGLGAGLPTTLYTLDATNDRLAIQNAPNGGTQTELHPITVGGSPLDFTTTSGFDIPGSVQAPAASAAAEGAAYAVLTVGGTTGLYAIELSTGVATAIGNVGAGAVPLSGLALGDGTRILTTTTVVPSPNPAVANALVTITASVTPAAAEGTVAFSSNNVPLAGCTAQPVTAGIATCLTAFPGAGTFSIGAAYSGSLLHASSIASAVTQTVTRIPTATALTVTPGVARLGVPVTMTATVTPADATGGVAFLANNTLIGGGTLVNGQATFTTSSLAAGSYQVIASYSATTSHQNSNSDVFTLTVAPTFRQHFAEGATGSFFQTDIGVLNASATAAANVTVRLFPEGVPALALGFTLDPLARRSLDLNAILAEHGIEGGVSTSIESDQPVAATRQMTWGTPVYGSTLESGVPDTSTAWYFAEGATNPYSLYYMIENPGSTEAQVTFTHLLEGGAAPITWNDVVAPFARRTFFINDVEGAGNASLSTAIASSVPIVAERAMYLNTTARQWEGGTATAGATSLSTTWSLAEGATGFFYTYLLLGNPGADEASVTVRYQLPDGETIEKTYAVAGQSRRTIDVRGEDTKLESATVGMTITSTLPVVAERVMWWGLPFYEGSVALGSTETGTVWAIGEGVEGGANNEATFVLVSNGSSTAGTVRFTVAYDDGTTQQKEYALAGTARLTVRVGEDFPDAQGRKFSVLVESVTEGMPITVEYSRYQSAGGGLLDGGGAALATLVR
jgi:Domain of unknown function (DUF4394)/Bacterial Ig-like domain (group 3)